MNSIPRYAPDVSKALEVILWIARERPGFDVYHIVKAVYFADKKHISEFGRPILGDDYEAAWFGPLPQVVYGLLRHDPISLLALGNAGPLPFKVDDAHRVFAHRDPNLRRLSESDVDALRFGVQGVDGKTFNELYEETHKDPAYLRAQGGRMDYRDFLPDDDPDKAEKAAYISEAAAESVF